MEPRVNRLEIDMVKLTGVVSRIADVVATVVESQKGLVDSQKHTDQLAKELFESQKRTDQLMQKLDEKMLETTEKLNALVQIVDDWIRKNPRPGA